MVLVVVEVGGGGLNKRSMDLDVWIDDSGRYAEFQIIGFLFFEFEFCNEFKWTAVHYLAYTTFEMETRVPGPLSDIVKLQLMPTAMYLR